MQAVIIAVLFAVTAAKPQARPKKTAYKHAHAYGPPYNDEAPKPYKEEKLPPQPYKEEKLPPRARRQTFYYGKAPNVAPNHAPAAYGSYHFVHDGRVQTANYNAKGQSTVIPDVNFDKYYSRPNYY